MVEGVVVRGCSCFVIGPDWRMALSGLPQQRDRNVSKEQNPNREKARAIRARQRVIGRELRRIYDGVAQEPVPDDFLDLLRKLDAKNDADPGKKSS